MGTGAASSVDPERRFNSQFGFGCDSSALCFSSRFKLIISRFVVFKVLFEPVISGLEDFLIKDEERSRTDPVCCALVKVEPVVSGFVDEVKPVLTRFCSTALE